MDYETLAKINRLIGNSAGWRVLSMVDGRTHVSVNAVVSFLEPLAHFVDLDDLEDL